jgi:hypothetical protein
VALVAKTYVFEKLDEDGDQAFTGTISNVPAHIIAMFDPDGALVKVGVYLITPDEDARPKYDAVIELLSAKYGAPDLVVHRFDSPYEAGDGHEERAIKDGKAHIAACWAHGQVKTDVAQDALCSKITTDLTVAISYESDKWDHEADRRSAKAAKDL